MEQQESSNKNNDHSEEKSCSADVFNNCEAAEQDVPDSATMPAISVRGSVENSMNHSGSEFLRLPPATQVFYDDSGVVQESSFLKAGENLIQNCSGSSLRLPLPLDSKKIDSSSHSNSSEIPTPKEKGEPSSTSSNSAPSKSTDYVDIEVLNLHVNSARGFPDNYIMTSKYSLLSFIPLNLLQQLRKISNAYFLLTMILTLIPGVSPVSPLTVVMPFALVIGVAMIKDGYEEVQRRESDKRSNRLPATVLRNGHYTTVPSSDILVGDVLRIKNGEEIRADCVVISSSFPDGVCYIDTTNLDGENNLKLRRAVPQTIEKLNTKKKLLEKCCVSNIRADKRIITQAKANLQTEGLIFRRFFRSLWRETVSDFKEQDAAKMAARQKERERRKYAPRLINNNQPLIFTDPEAEKKKKDELKRGNGQGAGNGGRTDEYPHKIFSMASHFFSDLTSPLRTRRRHLVAASGATAHYNPNSSTQLDQEIFSAEESEDGDSTETSRSISSTPFSQQSPVSGAPGLRSAACAITPTSASRSLQKSITERIHGVFLNGGNEHVWSKDPSAAVINCEEKESSIEKKSDTEKPTKGVVISTCFPDSGLLHWQGQLHLDGEHIPLGLDNFLYRGAVLRNTEYANAVVVGAGIESKMFLNLKVKPPKLSRFDKLLNILILSVFFISITIDAVMAGLFVSFVKRIKNEDIHPSGNSRYWYIKHYTIDSGALVGQYFWRFISYFILNGFLIPISLFITLELNKRAQVVFIGYDVNLAEYTKGKWRFCRPYTSNLTSQLAKVKYVFTDKTGTLTENCMRYVGGLVNGQIYRVDGPLPGDDLIDAESDAEVEEEEEGGGGGGSGTNISEDQINLYSPESNSSAEKHKSEFLPLQKKSSDQMKSVHIVTPLSVSDVGPSEGGLPRQIWDFGKANLSPSLSRVPSLSIGFTDKVPEEVRRISQRDGLCEWLLAAGFQPPYWFFSEYRHKKTEATHRSILEGSVVLPQFVHSPARKRVSPTPSIRYASRKRPARSLEGTSKSMSRNQSPFTRSAGAMQTSQTQGVSIPQTAPQISLAEGIELRKKRNTYSDQDALNSSFKFDSNINTTSAVDVGSDGEGVKLLARPEMLVQATFDALEEQIDATYRPLIQCLSHNFEPLPRSAMSASVHSQHSRRAFGSSTGSSPQKRPLHGLRRAQSNISNFNFGKPSYLEMPAVSLPCSPQLSYRSDRPRGEASCGSICEESSAFPPCAANNESGASYVSREHVYASPHVLSPRLHGIGGDSGSEARDRRSPRRNNAAVESHPTFLYMLCMAACNTLMVFDPAPNSDGKGSGSAGNDPRVTEHARYKKVYDSQSLDEVALGRSAAEAHFQLLKRTQKRMTIEVMGCIYVYDIISIQEFSSERKRMSIIVRRNMHAEREEKAYWSVHKPGYENHGKRRNPGLNRSKQMRRGSSHIPSSKNDEKRSKKDDITADQLEKKESLISVLPPCKCAACEAPLGTGCTKSKKNSHLKPEASFDAASHSSLTPRSTPLRKSVLGGEFPKSPTPSGTCLRFREGLHELDFSSIECGTDISENTSTSKKRFNNTDALCPYILLCKGADSAMLDEIDLTKQYNVDAMLPTRRALDKFSREGYRTLVFAYKRLLQEEIDDFLPRFERARIQIGERDAALHDAYNYIEKQMSLIGVAALEDKLQAGVPQTLRTLLQANIVVWMLTGDKRETAVTIAGSSGLAEVGRTPIIHIEVNPTVSLDERRLQCEKQMRNALERCKSFGKDNSPLLVIDGVSLSAAISVEDANLFFELGSHCCSAVCCRLTPLQKAEIVYLFQSRTGTVTLAIGDGANDVSMIQEAGLGIGIMGLEGSQAELASDFAIPTFRHLTRLMFVHGRYSLFRDSQTVLFSLYKGFFIATLQIYFNFYTGYSANTVVSGWLLPLFNLFYCQIQFFAMGIFDCDCPDTLLESNPYLYRECMERNIYFSARSWASSIGTGIAHGLLLQMLYYICAPGLQGDPSTGDRVDGGQRYEGTILFMIMVFIIDIMVLLKFMSMWNAITITLNFVPFLLLVANLALLSSIPVTVNTTELRGLFLMILGNPYIYYFVSITAGVLFFFFTMVKLYFVDNIVERSHLIAAKKQTMQKCEKYVQELYHAMIAADKKATDAVKLLDRDIEAVDRIGRSLRIEESLKN